MDTFSSMIEKVDFFFIVGVRHNGVLYTALMLFSIEHWCRLPQYRCREKTGPVGGSFDSQMKPHWLCPHLKCTLQNINMEIKQAVIDENINKMQCYIRVKGTYKIRLREMLCDFL